jgi:hypothetical protein
MEDNTERQTGRLPNIKVLQDDGKEKLARSVWRFHIPMREFQGAQNYTEFITCCLWHVVVLLSPSFAFACCYITGRRRLM